MHKPIQLLQVGYKIQRQLELIMFLVILLLLPMTILANCQQVRYSTNWVYVNATGIPAYPTGIFTGDGNTNVAGNQNAIYRIPLNPTQNTGTPYCNNWWKYWSFY